MKIYEKILNGVLCGQFATQYSHLNKIIDGQYLFDCSGFVENVWLRMDLSAHWLKFEVS